MEVIIAEEKYLKTTLLSKGLLTYLPLLCHQSIVQCRVTPIKANGKSLAYINPLAEKKTEFLLQKEIMNLYYC